jgi:hypothetical protein
MSEKFNIYSKIFFRDVENFVRHLCVLVLRHQMQVSNYFVNSFYSASTHGMPGALVSWRSPWPASPHLLMLYLELLFPGGLPGQPLPHLLMLYLELLFPGGLPGHPLPHLLMLYLELLFPGGLPGQPLPHLLMLYLELLFPGGLPGQPLPHLLMLYLEL